MTKAALFFGFLSVFTALVIPFVPDESLPAAVGIVVIGTTGFMLFQREDE